MNLFRLLFSLPVADRALRIADFWSTCVVESQGSQGDEGWIVVNLAEPNMQESVDYLEHRGKLVRRPSDGRQVRLLSSERKRAAA